MEPFRLQTTFPKGYRTIRYGFLGASMDIAMSLEKAKELKKKGYSVRFVEPKNQTEGFEKFYLVAKKKR